LIGARDSEDTLHENQLRCLLYVWWRMESSWARTKKLWRNLSKLLTTMKVHVYMEQKDKQYNITLICGDMVIVEENVPKNHRSHDRKMNFMVDQMLYLLNQCNRTRVEKFFDDMQSFAHWGYHAVWNEYLTNMSPYLSREACAAIPHVKRELRQRFVKGVKVHDEYDLMVDKCTGKVKMEKAKGGTKVPRIFVDYGAGCMYGNELPEFCKVAIAGEHVVQIKLHGRTIVNRINIVAKPRKDSLEIGFNELMACVERRNEIYTIIYSDDMVMAGNIDGIPFCKNIDISSCDSGNRQLTFALYGGMLGNFSENRALGSIAQCMKPVELVNPYNGEERLIVRFDGPNEGSGFSGTTMLNHIASYNNAVSTTYDLANCLGGLRDNIGNDPVRSPFITGPAYCGHKTTVDDCYVDGTLIPEKIQFLKHSPIQTVDGDFIPVMNFGCINRSLGMVLNDLTPEKLGVTPEHYKLMSYSERMDRFWTSVVSGYVHMPQCNFINSLRERFGNPGCLTLKPDAVLSHVIEDPSTRRREFGEWTDTYVDYSSRVLDETSIGRRYDLTAEELAQIGAAYVTVRIGSRKYVPAVDRLYEVDYGL